MDFFDSLLRYETNLWNHLDGYLRNEGATLAQSLALRSIARGAGTARVGDLRADLRITVGAASKLVDRLERDGLAVRTPDPDDGRSSTIALTEEGSALLTRATAALDRELADHLAGVTIDADLLRRTLDRLDARIPEMSRA